MSLEQFLNSRIGARIEVFSMNQYIEGILIEARDGYFVLDAEYPSYVTPTERVGLLVSNVAYIRFLSAA